MLEPLPLVLLEIACWLIVMLAVGISIALVHAGIDRVFQRDNQSGVSAARPAERSP